MRNIIALSLLAILLACDAKTEFDHSGYLEGEFPYYFYESTGQNQFILLENREEPIQWNKKDSDPDALLALQSLKWTVLYLNSKGQIKLKGSYNVKTKDFVLKNWTIGIPFRAYVETETEVMDKIVKVKPNLEESDFDGGSTGDLSRFQSKNN